MRLFASIIPVAAAALLAFSASFNPDQHSDVDALIADAAYNKVMPVPPLDYEAYHARVTDRLEFIEEALRGRDVSDWPDDLRAERERNLDRLRAYRLQGEFPINYDHDEQLPCFYDRDGNFCAVAWLIGQSAGMDLVHAINNRYRYATVSEMDLPELDRWIAKSGLTYEEVVTIQEPGFTDRVIDPVLANSAAITTPQEHPVDSISAAIVPAIQPHFVEEPTVSAEPSVPTAPHAPDGATQLHVPPKRVPGIQ